MRTEDDLIDDIFVREGDRYGDPTTRPPIDQPTARGGVVLGTLQDYLDAHGGGIATIEQLQTLTHVAAAEIIRWKLRQIGREALIDAIDFEPLRLQMIDFAYNSDAPLAMRWLQRVLRVPRTGRMDEPTLSALDGSDLWLVHQALIAARLQMIDLWSDPDPTRPKDVNVRRKQFEEGLENRALTFSLLAVP